MNLKLCVLSGSLSLSLSLSVSAIAFLPKELAFRTNIQDYHTSIQASLWARAIDASSANDERVIK